MAGTKSGAELPLEAGGAEQHPAAASLGTALQSCMCWPGLGCGYQQEPSAGCPGMTRQGLAPCGDATGSSYGLDSAHGLYVAHSLFR